MDKKVLDKIQNDLVNLKIKHKQDLKKAKFYFYLTFTIVITVAIIPNAILLLPLLYLSVSSAFKYYNRYSKNIEREVNKNVIQELLPEANYDHGKGLEIDFLDKDKTGIVDVNFKYFNSDDYIIVDYKGWTLEASELYASNNSWLGFNFSVIRGHGVKITLPVSFSHTLIIQSKQLKNKAKHQHELRLESMNWENLFYTYCDDGVFARYILNPAVMLRIENLQQVYKDIGISFIDNNINILWDNSRNPNLDNSSSFVSGSYQVWEMVLNLVKELQLGREIWTRKEFAYKKKT